VFYQTWYVICISLLFDLLLGKRKFTSS